MSLTSFDVFKEKSQTQYATDLARVENISFETARAFAAEVFDRMVNDGMKTKGHDFFDVVATEMNETVGFLWLAHQERFGRMVTSINDISIDPSHRGQGLGKNLMDLAEREARGQQSSYVRLHVFEHNAVAKSLYTSMGFVQTSLDMRKAVNF